MADFRMVEPASAASAGMIATVARWHEIQAKHCRKRGEKRDMIRHERIAAEMNTLAKSKKNGG